MSDSDDEQYTLRWRGRESGPYPLSEINRMLDEHDIGTGHEILYQEKWMALEEFFAATAKAATPPPAPAREEIAAPNPAAVHLGKSPALRFKLSVSPAGHPLPHPEAPFPSVRPRNRMVFAFLAIALGFVGAHNFYARQWLTGLLQLLLSIATSLMGFGIIASWLWAMVEALVVRKDGSGAEMT